jgi:NusA-like KH domain protein
MDRIIDMKFMRYLNLFEKITRVRTQHCFVYNSTLIFLVPKDKISRALGDGGKNARKLYEILEKKVKVIAIPDGTKDMRDFIVSIVYPVKFNAVEIKDGNVTITAGMQSRAVLIGRNKTRLSELKDILGQYFGIKEVKIV